MASAWEGGAGAAGTGGGRVGPAERSDREQGKAGWVVARQRQRWRRKEARGGGERKGWEAGGRQRRRTGGERRGGGTRRSRAGLGEEGGDQRMAEAGGGGRGDDGGDGAVVGDRGQRRLARVGERQQLLR